MYLAAGEFWHTIAPQCPENTSNLEREDAPGKRELSFMYYLILRLWGNYF